MAWTPDFSLIGNTLNNTQVDLILWIFPVMLCVLTILLITRNKDQWGLLVLPVGIMYRILGLNVPYVYVLVGVIMYAQQTLSMQVLGQMVQALGGVVASSTSGLGSAVQGNVIMNKAHKYKVTEAVVKEEARRKKLYAQGKDINVSLTNKEKKQLSKDVKKSSKQAKEKDKIIMYELNKKFGDPKTAQFVRGSQAALKLSAKSKLNTYDKILKKKEKFDEKVTKKFEKAKGGSFIVDVVDDAKRTLAIKKLVEKKKKKSDKNKINNW